MNYMRGKWAVTSCLLWHFTGLPVFPLSVAQDVASPEMPNVDVETEGGRHMERDRAAICRFFMLMFLERNIQMAEVEDDHAVDLQTRLKHELNAIPGKALAECPEDFRLAMEKWKDACEKELAESGSVSDELRYMMAESMKLLMGKYMVDEALNTSIPRLLFPFNGEGQPDKKELLEYYKDLKEKIESGKVVIPVETERDENR